MLRKKRKIDKVQVSNPPGRRVGLISDYKVSDSARRVMCISADEDKDDSGSGPTPFVLELVSIAAAWSPAKPREEEGVDSAVY